MKSVLYSTGILFPGYTNEGKVLGEYEIGKFIYSKYHHDQILGSLKIFLDNPLFGIGAKNFKNTFFKVKQSNVVSTITWNYINHLLLVYLS